ncbi:MAG: hypothetical protein ACKVRN_11400 [Pyrinomonadaceae bacterium]
MTSGERRSATNAIWLCQNCGKRIDNDEYRFTCELLYEWKEDAEAYALSEIGKAGDDENDWIVDDSTKIPPGRHFDQEFELEDEQGIFYHVNSDRPVNVMVFPWEGYEAWRNNKGAYEVFEEGMNECLVRGILRPEAGGSFVFVVANESGRKTKLDILLAIVEDDDS